jgi:cytochrome c553
VVHAVRDTPLSRRKSHPSGQKRGSGSGCDSRRLSTGQSIRACQKAKVRAIFYRPVTRKRRSISQVGEQCGGNFGECVTMKIGHATAITVLGASLSTGGSPTVLADDQKPASAQQDYAPPLNLLMVATQLSHFKLWYAGAVKNWPLANYELTQIRTGIDRARHLYPNNAQSNMTMIAPEVEEVANAIKAKDSVKFSEAYSKLTAACNACHEATGFGFITMRDPRLSPIETSPFSDESFLGH